ncbi:hypothetical protein EYV94_19590 [Puteibacter caeruleilacunae]|nr:hypothetical protein EYV94_19590 [Puteibacter caeruleilacunae]
MGRGSMQPRIWVSRKEPSTEKSKNMTSINQILNMTKNKIVTCTLMLCLTMLSACKINYTFTGASINYETTKTFSVADFPNRARMVNPNLSPEFVEALKDKLISQTSLEMVRDGGDIMFEGQITKYDVRPMSIQANDVAAKNRLTVSMKVRFTNNVDHEQDFETSFSAYAEFNSTQLISTVEDDLMDEIIEQLTEDIFNRALANW